MRDPLITPIILAGGSGTRLWPKSRRDFPKQFLPLIGDDSLFQKTLWRVRDKTRFHPPIVITNCEYKFLVQEQVAECGVELGYLILEPVARNTAPAITATAMIATEFGMDNLLIMPSDHLLTDDDHYASALEQASVAVSGGALVAFGIEPSYPAAGYGYIESSQSGFCEAPVISRFIEKPDIQIAQSLVEQDNIYWNAGMFMFSASAFLTECKELCPKIFSAVEQAVQMVHAVIWKSPLSIPLLRGRRIFQSITQYSKRRRRRWLFHPIFTGLTLDRGIAFGKRVAVTRRVTLPKVLSHYIKPKIHLFCPMVSKCPLTALTNFPSLLPKTQFMLVKFLRRKA